MSELSTEDIQNALLTFRERLDEVEDLNKEKGTGRYNRRVSSEFKSLLEMRMRPQKVAPIPHDYDIGIDPVDKIGSDGFYPVLPSNDCRNCMGLDIHCMEMLDFLKESGSTNDLAMLSLSNSLCYGDIGHNLAKLKQNMDIALGDESITNHIYRLADKRDAAWNASSIDGFMRHLGLEEPFNIYHNEVKDKLTSLLYMSSYYEADSSLKDRSSKDLFKFLYKKFWEYRSRDYLLPSDVIRTQTFLYNSLKGLTDSNSVRCVILCLELSNEILVNKLKCYRDYVTSFTHTQNVQNGLDINSYNPLAIKGLLYDLGRIESTISSDKVEVVTSMDYKSIWEKTFGDS